MDAEIIIIIITIFFQEFPIVRTYLCIKFINLLLNDYELIQDVFEEAGKGKVKVLPITGHEGPEGEYRFSPTLS